ncbi:hypothetical protein CRUP_032255, partial [Coryphaenoides rupestris]
VVSQLAVGRDSLGMAVVIRLQGLPIVAGTMDIRHFFSGLTIPDGGVHIMADCVSRVELTVSCTNLLDKDLGSKSDPLCVLMLSSGEDRWTEVGRTERVNNCSSPSFSERLQLDYHFETVQKVKLMIYDIDNKSVDLKDDDFLGGVELTLGQVTAEEVKDKRAVVLELEGKGLDKKDLFGKSDPFLEFFKQGAGGQWHLVYRTEVVKNSLDPSWKKFTVSLQTFCNGDLEAVKMADCVSRVELTVSCTNLLDKDLGSKSDPLCVLMLSSGEDRWTEVGRTERVNNCSSPSFSERLQLDYHFETVKLMIYDIDNKSVDLKDDDFLGGVELTLGQVNCSDSDSDGSHDLIGCFTTKVSELQKAAHGSPVEFECVHPEKQKKKKSYKNSGIVRVKTCQGIVESYRQALPQLRLSGPTNFSPIINHVASIASNATQTTNTTQYFVLLILTDGEITDLDQTKEAIVRASRLPLSIIIVGVGPADFKAMELLDGDDGQLRSPGGEAVARDIVQFVPYRQFTDSPKEALARSVLAEVPNQLVSYFKMRGLEPAKVAPPKA